MGYNSIKKDKDCGSPDKLLFSWLYSPTGRYAVELQRQEIDQPEQQSTHFYLYRFIVLDVFTNIVTEYKTLNGPLKALYTCYWLSDNCLILVDFSRFEGCLRQNIFMVNHEEKKVDCRLARSYLWSVDDMVYVRDSSAERLKVNGKEYFVPFAFRDHDPRIFFRLLPFHPLRDDDIQHEFAVDEDDIIQKLTKAPPLFPLAIWTVRGHPLICGSRVIVMTSLLEARKENKTAVDHFLSIDMARILEKDSNMEYDVNIDNSTAGVSVLQCSPGRPGLKNLIIGRPNIYNSGDKLVIWPRHLRKRSHDYRVFVVDLKNAIYSEAVVRLNRRSFLTIHPNGGLWAWSQSVSGSHLRSLAVASPMLRPPSLLAACQMAILANGQNDVITPYLQFLFQ